METGKLSKKIVSILLDESNDIYYSPISLWEISIKYGLKKLALNGGTPDDFFDELNNSYYLCKTVDTLYLATNYKLPIRHKDPFDRLILATAMVEDMALMTADEDVQKYDVSWVW